MKNPRVQFREAQTPTLLGKARFKEDSLWRQTAPLGRYSIWNPRVQLDRLWVKKKGACWASKQQKKTQVQSRLKCWDTHKHKFPTQFLGIHAWCLDRSDGATEKETMIPVIFGRRGSGFLSTGYSILTGAVSVKSLITEFSPSELNSHLHFLTEHPSRL